MKFFTLFSFFICLQFSSAQYWQQQVNYDIQVKLDDIKHELSAFESIEYKNNSPSTLSYIYMHLWPNAYQKKRTALFRQLEKNKNRSYYRLKENEFGGIDSLDFRVSGEKLKWVFCKKDSIDVAKVFLLKPLEPGESVVITTPFKVKIPSASISRLGHVGQQYQITQWYPKPAVFDKDGWQQMPYLNQGEFYSEFGTFDVKITLPENYVVGATGDLVDGINEEKWIANRVEQSKDSIFRSQWIDKTPESATNFKTLHFHQEQVHDFAWFTSKNYLIMKDEVELPNSKSKVTAWALFSPKYFQNWQNATKYVCRALYDYSKWNGDYIYKHATAVEGALSAGAGMEYPNITVLPAEGDTTMLDLVVAHEVGHNWFYGMLGTNERKYAWMDEGINTSNEIRYMDTHYQGVDLLKSYGVPSFLGKFVGLEKLDDRAVQSLEYIAQTRANMAQACNINAKDYSSRNYGAIVYAKSGLSFYYLRQYLGDELYDKVMKTYFETWKIKHPQPKDLQYIAESISGKNLTWLFQDLLGTKEVVDYKIKSSQSSANVISVSVKNKSDIPAPLNIGLVKDNKVIYQQWFQGFKNDSVLSLSTNVSDYDRITLDPSEVMLQPYRRNDHLKKNGSFKKVEPFQINFIGKFEDDKHTPINIAPVIGYNEHNKFMLGAWVHNLELPKHFEYQLMPMYAFGSNTIAGQGSFFYNTLKGERWSNAKMGIVMKSYRDFDGQFPVLGDDYISYSSMSRDYLKIAPEITFFMRNRNYNKAATSFFKFRSVNLYNIISPAMSSNKMTSINIFSYNYTKKLLLYQESVDPQLELSKDFGKLSASYKIRIVYGRKRSKGFSARAFGGVMLYNNLVFDIYDDENEPFSLTEPRYTNKLFSIDGLNDYLYDNTYIVRNPNGNGFFQRAWYNEKDGAMHNVPNASGNFNAIFSLNLKLDVPKLPIYFYHDFAVVNNKSIFNTNAKYGINNTGVALVVARNIAEIYFPLYNDRVDFYAKKNYAKAIRFQLNLDMLNPVKALKEAL
jgi:hypothetical protein